MKLQLGARRLLSMVSGVAVLAAALPVVVPAHANQVTRFLWTGSVVHTRHNMTQRTMSPDTSTAMDSTRNDYGEVCVYCHTPHGANDAPGIAAAPLWNRTYLASTTYQTYNSSTLSGAVTAPGVNSLTCLSCHDGTIAIDSIINMPGSGKYSAAAKTSHQEAFLDSWVPPPGNPGTISPNHHALGSTSPGLGAGCSTCHTPTVLANMPFESFNLGTDLRNDHPVGVVFPAANPDYNGGSVVQCGTSVRCFDTNGNGRPDSKEVRFYDTGDGYEVECSSCHDPHGAPSGALGGPLVRQFLRLPNTGSALCLTCHNK